MSHLLPATFLEDTTHLYLPQVRVRSRVLYGMVLGLVASAAAATFFVRVDVSFGASGLVRSVAEKTEIRAPVAGRVVGTLVHENQTVATGDTLLRLLPDGLNEKLRLNHFQQAERGQLLADLDQLTTTTSNGGDESENIQFQSSLYAQQYNQLQAALQENQVRSRKVEKELRADRLLYTDRVIATRELDAKEAEYSQLVEERRGLIERQRSQWQADRNTHRLTLTQLRAEATQFRQERDLFTLRAPVAGTLQQWVGKYAGSYVQAGELLGILSPDSSLLVECYVKPSDMGLLKLNQSALFRIDALNYREWGLARGTVTDIARDFTLVNENPVFRVKCRLETSALHLKNGYKARLQKGMTLQARLVVARRTLAQLLFDKVDDWLNPISA